MDQTEFETRADRTQMRKRARARHNRNLAIGVTLCVILAVGLGLGGWLIYSRAKANRTPAYETFRVTLPEGLTLKQTAAEVGEATEGNISAEAFTAATKEGGYDYGFLSEANGNLEGFLFPKTYEMTSLTSARTAVDKLLKQFEIETEDLEWNRTQSLGVSQYQIVIIASLIEEEAKVPGDRPLIASVIYNRLRKNMKLGIDATVQYALGQWKPELSNEDLKVDSPYNTYRVDGLPPAPICNPGFESIRAALYPASTDYIYYILTGSDGKHSFTADYNQFLKWKEEREKKSP
jgi:peptidoglycan lytic transglycosylase G